LWLSLSDTDCSSSEAITLLLLSALSTSIEKIVEIVGKDVVVSAKLLQLVNFAFFGFARNVSDLKTAVSCLGMGVLHDFFLTLEVFRAYTPNEYVSERYFEEFHHRSQLAARPPCRRHRCQVPTEPRRCTYSSDG
jgi:HD-like signal output (HDOD) protein